MTPDLDEPNRTPHPKTEESTLTSASAFATRFCVKFYATLLPSLAWSHCDRTSAEYHGAKEDSLLFLKFLHGHMVSRVN